MRDRARLCAEGPQARGSARAERKALSTHGQSNGACVLNFPAPASLGGKGHGGDTVDPEGAVEGLKEKRQEVGRAAGRASLGQRRGLAPEGREGMQRPASGGGTKGAPVGPRAGTEREGRGRSPRSQQAQPPALPAWPPRFSCPRNRAPGQNPRALATAPLWEEAHPSSEGQWDALENILYFHASPRVRGPELGRGLRLRGTSGMGRCPQTHWPLPPCVISLPESQDPGDTKRGGPESCFPRGCPLLGSPSQDSGHPTLGQACTKPQPLRSEAASTPS